MKRIFLIGTTFISLSLTAQNYSYRYTQVNQLAVQQNNYTVVNNNFGFYAIANAVQRFTNAWSDNKKREIEVQKSQFRIEQVKETYRASNIYPESILDGWHLVMVTDNYNFCNEAKAMVENGQIIKLVIDNYMPNSLNFTTINPIRNAKSLLSLKDENNNPTSTVEVYFTNDLEQPTIVDAPLEAGYICFYSDMGRAKSIKIRLEKTNIGELGGKIEDEPACFDENTITIALKPQSYEFRAFGRGTINWEGVAVVKQGQCLLINLNEENKK